MPELIVFSRRFLMALGLVSLLCLVLVAARILFTGSLRYWFVPENLLLAWIPLGLSWILLKRLKEHRWKTWPNMLLSVLWLTFLPNTWYVLTDFMHIYPTGEISEFFDISIMAILVGCGFVLGFASLYAVHRRLIQRFGLSFSHLLVALILLLSSFAIYLGRDLRWNSWDVLTSPDELIYNVSDQIIDPLGHPRAVSMTGLFFVLLGTQYAAIWLAIPPKPAGKRR